MATKKVAASETPATETAKPKARKPKVTEEKTVDVVAVAHFKMLDNGECCIALDMNIFVARLNQTNDSKLVYRYSLLNAIPLMLGKFSLGKVHDDCVVLIGLLSINQINFLLNDCKIETTNNQYYM